MSADKKTPGVLCFLPACAHARARWLDLPPSGGRVSLLLSFFLSCPQGLGEGSASFAALAVSGRGPTFLVSCCFLFLSSAPRCLPAGLLASMPACWSAGLDVCLLACWPRCLPAGLLASMPACWPAGLDCLIVRLCCCILFLLLKKT